jgi:dolichyl-phosphate-mannose--protein O-mannosyl transferase
MQLYLSSLSSTIGQKLKLTEKRAFWFIVVLTFTAFVVRAWQISNYPPGLNQDEASIGYDSFAILHYGMDRNGIAYPAMLISWGSGQNALYAYLAMPFIAVSGLSIFTLRLPMLFAGVLCIPLVWRAVRVAFGRRTALIATVLVCFSPWHIMLSRWALESNVIVFFFLLGYYCLVLATRRPIWLIPSWAMFSLCLYAYGTAYLAVPLFLVGSLVILRSVLCRSWRLLLISMTLALLLAIPILSYIVVNSLKLDGFQIGPVGIPRLPVAPRYETQSVFFPFSPATLQTLGSNLKEFADLMWKQDDRQIWNALPTIGFAYGPVTLFLACIGMVLGTFRYRNKPAQLMLLWTVIGVLVGFVQSPNINRINLLLMPFHVWVAVAISMLAWSFWLRRFIVLIAIGMSAVFLYAYVITYRGALASAYFDGFLPSLAQARQLQGTHICVTDDVNMPYIYTLFADQPDPRVFNQSVTYLDEHVQFRFATQYGAYTFGLQRCDRNSDVYVLRHEKLPTEVRASEVGRHGEFVVYHRNQEFAHK